MARGRTRSSSNVSSRVRPAFGARAAAFRGKIPGPARGGRHVRPRPAPREPQPRRVRPGHPPGPSAGGCTRNFLAGPRASRRALCPLFLSLALSLGTQMCILRPLVSQVQTGVRTTLWLFPTTLDARSCLPSHLQRLCLEVDIYTHVDVCIYIYIYINKSYIYIYILSCSFS